MYMEVYEGIWRYIRVYEPSFSTLFFFNLLGVHFFYIVFVSAFLKVYGAREVAHLFSYEISRRMPSESCLGTHF